MVNMHSAVRRKLVLMCAPARHYAGLNLSCGVHTCLPKLVWRDDLLAISRQQCGCIGVCSNFHPRSHAPIYCFIDPSRQSHKVASSVTTVMTHASH
jgi:hypothetical protein